MNKKWIILFVFLFIGVFSYALYQSRLIQDYFSDSHYVTLMVNGMTCDACSVKIEKSLKMVKGVREVSVDYGQSTCQIEYNPHYLNSSDFVQSVTDLGFEARKKTNLKVLDYNIRFKGSGYR
tara:strand:- start:510 stop:875 length:366 start_codon:yes stop_codon:yes gene_type:complete